MMMKRFSVIVLFAMVAYTSRAQSTSPAQTLRLATSTYEQGRLHELEGILKNLTGFTKEQKVAAYKLLTQAYIYLEEPKKADTTMLKLLSTDNYFAINKEIDPAEFVALYNTFRTEPVFALALRFSPMFIQPTVATDFYTTADARGTGKYSPGISISAGLVFEKKIKGRFTLSPELLYASRKFTDKTNLFERDNTNELTGSIDVTYLQAWLDLNLLTQYQFGKKNSLFSTYLSAGPGLSYNLRSFIQPVTTGLSEVSVSGPDIDIKGSTEKLMYSFIVGGGAKLRIGSIFVSLEVRYQYGINKVINFDTRTNYENVLDYGYQLNDFRLSNASLNLGVSYPFFKPIKLKNK